MSLYKSSPDYIARRLSLVDPADRVRERFKLDLASVFIGPACKLEAERLIDRLFEDATPEEIADVLVTIGSRYNNS